MKILIHDIDFYYSTLAYRFFFFFYLNTGSELIFHCCLTEQTVLYRLLLSTSLHCIAAGVTDVSSDATVMGGQGNEPLRFALIFPSHHVMSLLLFWT